jgi:hypothetical protein
MAASEWRWATAETGPHYTVTCPADGTVACTPELGPGIWEVIPVGDSVFARLVRGPTNTIPTTDGQECRYIRDGGGGFVLVQPDHVDPVIALKSSSLILTAVHVQRVG